MKTTKLKQIFSTAVVTAMIAAPISATPEISFDGAFNLNGTKVKNANMSDISSIKMNIEGEVADGINATAILQVGGDNRVNEAYLTFDNIVDTLIGDLASGSEMFNFKTSLGKKAIQFGTEGNKYFNETQFIGKSLVAQKITGTKITTGEGAEVSFDLPTPAPVNVSVGAFENIRKNHLTTATDTYDNSRPLFTLRTTTELEVSNFTIDLGASALLPDNKDTALGLDAKLSMDTYSLGLEVASQKDKSESKTNKFYAATLGYEINETYNVAVRYTGTKNASNTDEKVLSLLGTKQLSDTAKIQVQYNNNKNTETASNIQAQFVIRL
jgi:hypothetical protein